MNTKSQQPPIHQKQSNPQLHEHMPHYREHINDKYGEGVSEKASHPTQDFYQENFTPHLSPLFSPNKKIEQEPKSQGKRKGLRARDINLVEFNDPILSMFEQVFNN